MSIPYYYKDGCLSFTTYNRRDYCPWYLSLSPVITKEEIDNCPTHTHIITHCTQAIYVPFLHLHVGNLEWNADAEDSACLILEEHKYRSWFRWKDIYCRECSSWHFKDID